MPTLTLQICPPQPPQVHASIARGLTQLTAQTLGKRADLTAVLIEEWPPGRWFIGGQAVQRPTALLSIRITAGTNSAAQKAAFVREAHALLRQLLAVEAGLEEASYVVVHELPAPDWGYDGRTQQARLGNRSIHPTEPTAEARLD